MACPHKAANCAAACARQRLVPKLAARSHGKPACTIPMTQSYSYTASRCCTRKASGASAAATAEAPAAWQLLKDFTQQEVKGQAAAMYLSDPGKRSRVRDAIQLAFQTPNAEVRSGAAHGIMCAGPTAAAVF